MSEHRKATKENAEAARAAGRAAEDVHLVVVSKTYRAEDIELLVNYYLDYFAVHEGLPRREFSSGARARLADYDWPGNARELKNLVQRLMILGSTEQVTAQEINSALGIRPQAEGDLPFPGFDLPLREASVTSIAGGLLHRSLEDLPLDEPSRAARRYLAMTAAQVQAAFARWLDPARLVQVTLGPPPG